MKFFKRFFEFYINSSIHVSFAVVALTLITYLSLNIFIDKTLIAFVFFGSITGYNFVKYAEVAGLHHRSLTSSLRWIQIFSFLCFLLMCFFGFNLSREVLLTLAILGGLTLFYAVPIFSRKRNLRSLQGIKIFIVALVWSGVTVLLPLFQIGGAIDWDVWMIFIQRFLFVITIILPFEIRDIQFDSETLGTIPQKIGKKRTQILGALFLLFLLCIEFLKDTFSYNMVIKTLCICVITTIGIYFSNEKQSRYFASFWIESLPIVWLLLYFF